MQEPAQSPSEQEPRDGDRAPSDRSDWLLPAIAAGAVALAVLLPVVIALLPAPAPPRGPPVTVSPAEGELPRLGPIVIAFRDEPRTREASQLISLEPQTDLAFAWTDERTLLVQPEFPGLLRGGLYHLRVEREPAGLDEDFEVSFTVEGRLEVDAVIPGDGDRGVPVEAEIYVQFSRSVAPLTVLQAPQAGPAIEFDPPLDGEGEWLNTSIYRFRPANLQPSTVYRARIPSGLTTADDGVLEADFEWSFETVGPSLVASHPADNTRFVPRDSSVTLTFDQPMDRASVEAGIAFETGDGAAVPHAVAWDEEGAVITLAPAQPLALSTTYHVRLDAGLRGAVRGATESERTIRFSTSDPPELIRSEPADGATNAGRWGIRLHFNNPMDLDSIEDRLSITGIDLEHVRLDSWDERSIHIPVSLQPSTEYTVTIAEGATDREGLPLGPVSITFTTGRLNPSVGYAAPGRQGVYSASADAVLYYRATNMDRVDFELRRVSTTRGHQLLGDPMLDIELIIRSDDEVVRRWSETVEGAENASVLASTSLGDGEFLEPGFYYVFSPNAPQRIPPLLAFAVTDTSIITKLGHDELLIWVIDSDSGEPLSGVEVQVSGPRVPGDAGILTTDADGLATLAVPTRRDLMNLQVNRHYRVMVHDGDHFGYGRTNWQRGVNFWQLGVPLDRSVRLHVGHLYTDRPIYRPGETVHYKAVVRVDEDATYRLPERDADLRLTVYNPRREEIEEIDVELSEFGTISAEFTLPEDAPIGIYQVQVTEPGWRDSRITVAATSISVAEFRVPEFEVAVQPSVSDVIDGETFQVEAAATFFFGGPVTDATARWSVLSSPMSVRFEGYEQYSFTDFDPFDPLGPQPPQRGDGEAAVGADGIARFPVTATLRGGEPSQLYTLSVTVEDPSGQAIADSARVRVHPAEQYAGIATDAYVAREGEATRLDIVTVDTEGDAAPGRAVTLRIYAREWVTVREETEAGGRRYRSEPHDTLLDEFALTTDGDGEATMPYTPDGPGLLRLVVETADEQGRTARAARYLWVAGAGHVPWRLTNDDVIELVADRDEYEVGDVAEVLVPAPFAGAVGLVTVERGNTLDRSVRRFESNSELLEIPIEDGHIPNVFVSVVLYRAPTDADPIPRYHVGYVELPVSAEPRRLQVEIEPDQPQAEPGDTVEYEIRVTDQQGNGVPSELSVAIVDQAVLSLRQEMGPDGMGAFWFRRGLGVETGSSLAVSVNRANDLISEPEEGGKGGGFLDDDESREEFRNTALWEGRITTDAEGRASVTVTMPDNLTTWRTQVRAVSGATLVGEATHELLVTRPLLIRPALPRFLRVGDEVQLRVLVRNGSPDAEEIAVTLQAEGVAVEGPAMQSRTVAPGASGVFVWPATVHEEGEARLTFRAAGGAEQDALTLTVPIHLDVTQETMATGGAVTDATAIESVYLPPFAIADRSSLDVLVQASLVDALTDELWHLRPLASESNVRIASRVTATINARRAEGLSGDDLLSGLRGDLVALRTGQRVDGGWGWCRHPSCPTSMAATAWVLVALGEAHEAELEDVGGVAVRASGLVRRHIDRPADVERPADVNEHAFMLYALQRGGGDDWVEHRLRALVEQHRAQLTAWGRAYVILGLLGAGVPADDPDVRALIGDINAAMIPSANGNHWEAPPIFGSIETNISATALVLRALIEADPRHPLIDGTVRWLSIARTTKQWESEVERAQAITGLGRFAEATGERRGDYRYEVTLDERALLAGRFQPAAGLNEDETSVPLPELRPGEIHRLSFARETGPGRLYYGINLHYVTPAREIEALNRGLAVSRQYTLLEDPDTPITEARLGDVVRVTLTVVAPADRKYVRVNDYLPAGLEAIDSSLDIVPEELRQRLAEEQREAIGEAAPGYMAPWYRWYWSPWDETTVHDERFSLFATDLRRGVHEYVYFARATTPGDFFVAPAHAGEEAMPDVFGRSDSGWFGVSE